MATEEKILNGQTAMITGAARRVGRVIAETFAENGANVAVHYNRSKEEAGATVAMLRELGVEAEAFRADLCRDAEARELAGAVCARFGKIDILINSAAVYFKTPFESLTEKDWDDTLGPNLKGTFLATKHAADRMLKSGGGKIINIADWSALKARKDYIPYCASKAGVVSLTKSFAAALAPAISVNCISPGAVLLPEGGIETETERRIIEQTPLGRIGKPQDVASMALFLASRADWITGAVFNVDGGRSLPG